MTISKRDLKRLVDHFKGGASLNIKLGPERRDDARAEDSVHRSSRQAEGEPEQASVRDSGQADKT